MCCSYHPNKNDSSSSSNNNRKQNEFNSNKPNTHMILMAAFCLLPIAIAVLITRVKLGSYITLGYLPYAIFLLCPLSHFLMTVFMKDPSKAIHKNHK